MSNTKDTSKNNSKARSKTTAKKKEPEVLEIKEENFNEETLADITVVLELATTRLHIDNPKKKEVENYRKELIEIGERARNKWDNVIQLSKISMEQEILDSESEEKVCVCCSTSQDIVVTSLQPQRQGRK